MNLRLAFKIQGGLFIFLGFMLLTPIPVALLYPPEGAWHDTGLLSFIISSGACLGLGYGLYSRIESNDLITHREGFGIVTLGWVSFAVFGGLPYLISGAIQSPVDAFFEAMSGFTTTGSTVIPELAEVPKSILFWRSMTQWLGGMGIIVLSIAILPFLKVAGAQMFEAEAPGPQADRLSPRIQDTAKLLWGVYFLITFVECILLWLGGMTVFEAICHSLTTMATGGFSTEDASIGHWNSDYIHLVVTIFMFFAGVNFALHFHALRGRPNRYFLSEEFRVFSGIVAGGTLVLFLMNWPGYSSPWLNLRDSVFQTLSIITTTGFGSPDYERWPALSQYLLITMMFIGGCAGSTAGGMKVVRILLVIKHAVLQVSHLIHPREVRILKLDHQPVSREIIQSILGFFALFVGIFLIASLLLAAIIPPTSEGPDIVTAGGAVIACLGNIGPGVGEVGPTDNFAAIPSSGKLILAICMLVGRLEVFTVLVFFLPSFWRK